MVQVLQKVPTFGEEFGRAIGQGASQGIESGLDSRRKMKELAQENEDIFNATGIKIISKDPELRKMEFSEALKGKQKEKDQSFDINKQTSDQYFTGLENKAKREHEEKLQKQKFELEGKLKGSEDLNKKQKDLKENLEPLIGAKDALDQMKLLRKKGNLGRGSNVLGFFGGETAKDRGEYETLGNSLIQYATNIPIRNRIEFEKLAGHLSDPDITDSEAEGILNAMERIIDNSMKQYQNTISMKDSEGNEYDIPPELHEQAKKQGLIE